MVYGMNFDLGVDLSDLGVDLPKVSHDLSCFLMSMMVETGPSFN